MYRGAPMDAAFVHFRGIHTLYMNGCYQSIITDAAFVHLRGIQTHNAEGCYLFGRCSSVEFCAKFSSMEHRSLRSAWRQR